MSDNGGAFVFGFLVGAAAGAAAVLLLTPYSGEELRQQIGAKGVDLKGQVGQVAEDARSRMGQVTGNLQGQVTEVTERGRIVIADNVRKAQQAVQDAQTKLSKSAAAGDTA